MGWDEDTGSILETTDDENRRLFEETAVSASEQAHAHALADLHNKAVMHLRDKFAFYCSSGTEDRMTGDYRGTVRALAGTTERGEIMVRVSKFIYFARTEHDPTCVEPCLDAEALWNHDPDLYKDPLSKAVLDILVGGCFRPPPEQDARIDKLLTDFPTNCPEIVREQVGVVGVDSGQLVVMDPCYIRPDDPNASPEDLEEHRGNVSRIGNMVVEDTALQLNYERGHRGLAVGISGFGGDGCYPVFVEKDETGRVRRIVVELERVLMDSAEE